MWYVPHWIWSIPADVLCCATSSCMAPSEVGQRYLTIRYRYNMFMSGMSALFFTYALYQSVVTVEYIITPLMSRLWMGSKILEWADTCFLIRGQKKVRCLHYWHHLSTVTIFSLSTDNSQVFVLGMLLNGGIHTIMYRHYAVPLPSWARPYITKLQISQFMIGLAYFIFHYTEIITGIPVAHYWVCMMIMFSYLVLFVRMYDQIQP
jgi:hypothetical protein